MFFRIAMCTILGSPFEHFMSSHKNKNRRIVHWFQSEGLGPQPWSFPTVTHSQTMVCSSVDRTKGQGVTPFFFERTVQPPNKPQNPKKPSNRRMPIPISSNISQTPTQPQTPSIHSQHSNSHELCHRVIHFHINTHELSTWLFISTAVGFITGPTSLYITYTYFKRIRKRKIKMFKTPLQTCFFIISLSTLPVSFIIFFWTDVFIPTSLLKSEYYCKIVQGISQLTYVIAKNSIYV